MALQLVLFRNTKEGTPVSIITTLSEAFGIEDFTISISRSWILKQWREFNKGSAVAFLVDEWVTPDVGNSRQGKSYMPLRITNAMELLPRIVLSANFSLPIWRSRRTDIPSCPCWQIWLLGCDNLFRWQRCFCNVTHVSIQDKRSFGTKIMVRLIDLAKFVATSGIWVSLSFTVHIVTGCDTAFLWAMDNKHFHLPDQQ